MGRPDDVASLIRDGRSPADIAQSWDVTVSTVIGYAWRAIGMRQIRVTDVLVTLDEAVLSVLWSSGSAVDYTLLRRSFPTLGSDDMETYKAFGAGAGVLGDMYEDLRAIELLLFHFLVDELKRRFGGDELGWWRRVPSYHREQCVVRREHDPVPLLPEHYLDFAGLISVLENNKRELRDVLPPHLSPGDLANRLHEVRRIRNRVFHPLREESPEMHQYLLVGNLRRELEALHKG